MRNQPSAERPGSRSPSVFEVGARCCAILPRLIDGPPLLTLAHHFAVDDVERVGRRLQQFAGDFERFLAHIERRDMRRRRRHHRGARSVRADAEGDAVGLAVDHAALLVIDAERVGGNLRHHGLEALAERGAAGHDFDRAGRVDRNFTPSAGPSPLFSMNMATPMPTSSPAALRRFTSALSFSQSIAANCLSSSPM